MDFPTKKYTVIYVDPPWQYRDKAASGKRGAVFKYPCMSDDDIKSLPVGSISEKDSILFLWTTFPKIQEGLDTITAWGFTYKTIAFNWVKRNKVSDSFFWGMGRWTRSNSEICLLGTRGKPKRQSMKVHSVIYSPIREHSRKPDETRDRIMELTGDVSRVELFARQPTDGWDIWGNDTELFSDHKT